MAAVRAVPVRRASKSASAFIAVTLVLSGCVAFARAPTATAQTTPTDTGWPRQFQSGGYTLTVYQPQLDSWNLSSRLTARAAVSVKAAGQQDPTFGVIWFSAQTQVDKETRQVALEQLTITKVSFPSAPDQATAYRSALQAVVPVQARYLSLDRLESMVQVLQAQRTATLPLKNSPPAIIFSYAPAILVLIDGAPVWRGVPHTSFQRVLNTSPLVLHDPSAGRYYLHVYDGWMEATALTESWTVTTHPPRSLDRAERETETSHQVDLLTGGNANPKPSLSQGPVPVIFVATSPAELVVVDGPPNFLPIPGTQLLYVQNTTGRIFKDLNTQQTYVLISGRWFSAAQTSGPWTHVPGVNLPPDFAHIPDSSPMENVKASIPGTPQAQEAVIENSIAQTAVVNRGSAKLSPAPRLDGSPQLKPIAGTSLQYVANSSIPIIVVNAQRYYAVQAGIWFTAPSVHGQWAVATSVPAEIYAIPPSSPLYSLTFVQIYGFTPTVVYEGYLPGYLGAYVTDGVVVYGTGYTYTPWVGSVWYGPPVTYGFGLNITYTPWGGWGFSFGLGTAWGAGVTVGFGWGGWGWGCAYGGWYGPAYYGPRGYIGSVHGGGTAWGPGGWASTSGNIYHHWGNTSAVSRNFSGYNAWTGNSWRGTRGVAYNSRTGAAAAGGWGTVTNAYTGRTVKGGYVNSYHPRTGIASSTAYNANTGNVNRATYDTRTGQTSDHTYSAGTMPRPAHNNVFANKDGEIYRQDPSGGGWSQYRNDGSWRTTNDSSRFSQFDQDRSARQWGGFRSDAYQRSFGGGWRGGGGFRGGGFRR